MVSLPAVNDELKEPVVAVVNREPSGPPQIKIEKPTLEPAQRDPVFQINRWAIQQYGGPAQYIHNICHNNEAICDTDVCLAYVLSKVNCVLEHNHMAIYGVSLLLT